jgi:hypothetical protein
VLTQHTYTWASEVPTINGKAYPLGKIKGLHDYAVKINTIKDLWPFMEFGQEYDPAFKSILDSNITAKFTPLLVIDFSNILNSEVLLSGQL